MEYFIICAVTLVISVLTLFSGFGLGTVLMPVFALFFSLPIAIAATSIVHFANNIFKIFLVGKFANRSVVLRFGIPAAITAILGAYLLIIFADFKPLFSYAMHGFRFQITIISLIVGILVIISSFFDLVPKLDKLTVPPKYIPLGGAFSGFLGGLSGHQGILRSAFLIKSGLNKEQYIGTTVVCSIIVDTSRILIYAIAVFNKEFGDLHGTTSLILAACLTAFIGSYIGSILLRKVTFKTVQTVVGVMLLVLGLALLVGISHT